MGGVILYTYKTMMYKLLNYNIHMQYIRIYFRYVNVILILFKGIHRHVEVMGLTV